MTKTTSVFAGLLAVIITISFLVLTGAVSADTRDSRDRGATGRTVEPAPTLPSSNTAPTSTPIPPPTQTQTGGITNVTQGSADSGGNTGGNVTTGDEHVEVTVINIGPTNNPAPEEETPAPTPTPTPTPTPEPECDRRASDCTAQDPGRVR